MFLSQPKNMQIIKSQEHCKSIIILLVPRTIKQETWQYYDSSKSA